MLSLADYLEMIGDPRRVNAYRDAIAATVKPGDYVIELGAGFGYFSMLAARAGAARVDAVDMHPLVHLAPRLADANGVGGIVHAHQCDAFQFDPGKKAQVIIGDVRGASPFFGRSVDLLMSARDRLLAPSGRMIAQRDHLYCAPCREPKGFAERLTRVNGTGDDLSPIEGLVRDTPIRWHVKPEELLAGEQCWGTLDYRTVASADCRGEAAWTIAGGGRMGGLALWFEMELTPDVRFSTSPRESSSVYGQLFLPLRRPLDLVDGDQLGVTIRAVPAGADYLWEWSVRGSFAGGTTAITQNSLGARVIDPRVLKPSVLD